MTSSRRSLLQLPGPSSSARLVSRRRRPSRLRQLGSGVLLGAAGALLLVGLMVILERLNTFLLLSQSIAKLIGGIQDVVVGLVQLLTLVVLVALALTALVLIVASLVRFVRACLPRRRTGRS